MAPRRWSLRSRLLAWAALLGATLAILSITGCMERLFYYPQPGPTTTPATLRGVEDVWFEPADGTRLHGWFIPAAGGAEGAPSVLHVHGNAGNIESHVWFTEYLPASGFNVLVFDYRGFGRSEGTARRRGPLIADTNAALDALLARADVDPTRVGMYGQSLGGAIGLSVMADRPEIRAAVVESTFTSWREMASSAVAWGSEPGPVARVLAWLLIRDDHRPDRAVARIDRPILLLHGTADRTIPVAHGRRLAKAGRTIKLVELPGGDHNTLRETHPEIEQMVVAFLRGQLSAPR